MFWAERLAVHGPCNHAVIHDLIDWDGAVHAGRITAFGQDPFSVSSHPDLASKIFQQHACVLNIMHHAEGILAAIELCAAPFHTAISRTFKKIEAVGLWKAL